jgi:hypothetical protein
LSAQEKHLLAAHTEGFAQVAAKGMLVPPSPNERFVMDLQTQTDLARDLRAHLASDLRQTNAKGKINEWISSRGYRATLAGIPEAIERVNDSSLLPWTGVYATPDLGFVLTVIGSPHRNSWSAIYANQVPIKAFTFNNATLTWLATEGNPHSAELGFRMPSSNGTSEFRRALSGKFWDAGANEPAAANLEAREVAPAYSPLSVWTGRYKTRLAADGGTEGPEIAVVSPRPDQSPNVSHLTIDGKKVDSAVFERGALRWQGNRIEFTQSDGEKRLSGMLDGVNLEGALVPDDDAAFEGRYNAYLWSGSRWAPCGAFSYESKAVHIGRHAVEGARFDRNMLRWEAFHRSHDPVAEVRRIHVDFRRETRISQPARGTGADGHCGCGTADPGRRRRSFAGGLDDTWCDRPGRPQSGMSFSVVALAARPLYVPCNKQSFEKSLRRGGAQIDRGATSLFPNIIFHAVGKGNHVWDLPIHWKALFQL